VTQGGTPRAVPARPAGALGGQLRLLSRARGRARRRVAVLLRGDRADRPLDVQEPGLALGHLLEGRLAVQVELEPRNLPGAVDLEEHRAVHLDLDAAERAAAELPHDGEHVSLADRLDVEDLDAVLVPCLDPLPNPLAVAGGAV